MNDRPAKDGYHLGLDGLRAAALGVVLLFHSGYPWARGGFLSVSVFFTLSGFLITSQLFGEIDRSGRIDLSAFWSRRVRRLVPAAMLCLLFVALCFPLFAASARPAQLRTDVLSALVHMSNWRFVLAHRSYADLFIGGPTPVLHFWSLAVEEQFYLVVPALLALSAWGARRSRVRWLPIGMLVALLGACLVAVFATHSHDLSYYGTATRAPEFLVGALFAVLWRRSAARRASVPSWMPSTLGAAAVVVTLWMFHVVSQTDDWVYRGGFALVSLLWCVMLAGALEAGPMRRALSWAPLVRVGQLSYGIYLFHWPVFQLITPARLGTAGAPLLAMRLVATYGLALASYRLVEQPVRTRRISIHGTRALAAVATVMAVIVGVTALRSTHAVSAALSPMLAAPDHVVDLGAHAESSATSVPVPPADVVIVGSGDVDLSVVRAAVVEADPNTRVVDLTESGCGVFLKEMNAASCTAARTQVANYVAGGLRPAAVVLAVGKRDHDVMSRRLYGAALASADALAAEFATLETDVRVIDDLRATLGAGPEIAVLDDWKSDSLSTQLQIAAVRAQDALVVTSNDITPLLSAAIDRARRDTVQPARMRVMVIGDSTSYGVALELDRQASDKLQVVWAGYRNCPIVPATDMRWWPGSQFVMTDCVAAQQRWPAVAADLRPDVLLVVETLPEHSDQRYAGDANWHAVGDARFAEEHATVMQQLVDMMAPYRGTVMVADSAHSPTSAAARVAAWNALIATWPATWPTVSILPLSTFIEGAEAAAGHSLRPDGMHMDETTEAAAVATVYLPPLLQQFASRNVAADTPGASTP